MPFLSEMDASNGLITGELRDDKGKELTKSYNDADPFPHVVIDDFLPEPVLYQCVAEFPAQSNAEQTFSRAQERLKSSFNPDKFSVPLRCLFYSFNSRPFIKVLENITSISGLIPDPYFLGGGLHQISQGGHLSMHADFNHHKLMNLERRINVLIYLNEGWKAEYGGQLELWDPGMTRCAQSVVPLFNRCVIFSTTSQSMHGNPQPVNHPKGTPRRSIALYYYTSTWDPSMREHTTQFRVRPNSHDRTDWRIKATEIVNDLTPPILLRNLRRMKNRSLPL